MGDHSSSIDGHHQPEYGKKKRGTVGRDARNGVKPPMYNDDGGDTSSYGRDARSGVESSKYNDDGGDTGSYGRDARSGVKPKYNDNGRYTSSYGRDARSGVKTLKYNDDGGDTSSHGRDARSGVESSKYNDDGDDTSSHGRDARSGVESSKYNDARGDTSSHGRDARSGVESSKYNDDGDDTSSHGGDARSGVKTPKYNDDRGDTSSHGGDTRSGVKPKNNYDAGDTSPMEVGETDEEEEQEPVSAKSRKQNEETKRSCSHKSKTTSRTSNAKRYDSPEHVTVGFANMTFEDKANRTEYLNDAKGFVKVSSSVVEGNSSSSASDDDSVNDVTRKRTVGKYRAPRKTTTESHSKHGKNTENDMAKKCRSNVSDGSTNIINPNPRGTTPRRTEHGRSSVGLRGGTSAGRVPEDKCGNIGKNGDRTHSSGSRRRRSTGRNSCRGSSESGSGNSSRGSSKASETRRNISSSRSKSEDSRSGESSSSSSSGHCRRTSKRAGSRSSSRSSAGKSHSKGRNGRSHGTSEDSRSLRRKNSNSDTEEGQTPAQVVGKETSKSKQKDRSKAPKGNKNKTGRKSTSRERDISSSSKNSEKNNRSDKPKKKGKGSSTSSSSNKKIGTQNKQVRTRNKTKDRTRQDRSDSDDEGRNESADRSARSSSEIVPARPRAQYKWQYEDDHGWTTYGQIPSPRNSSGAKTVTSDDIELHYLEDEERCPLVIEINNVQYLLDFQKMTQTNQKTRNRRNIRRIIKHTMDDHSAHGQTNLSRNSSENTFPAPVRRDLTTDHSNNYDKHRSTKAFANDFSVKHVWQFEDEQGKWITYGKSNFVLGLKKSTTSDDIEKVYSKDPSKAIMRIQSKSNQYILNFRKMTQTNEETQVQRKVRRVPEHATTTSLAEKVKPFAGSLVGSVKEYITFEWQFEDENRMWITYGQANSAGMSYCTTTVTSEDIEKYYNSLPKKVMMTIKSSTNEYVLDFDTMTQTNEKTSVQRRIRRIPKISRDNKPQYGSSSSSALYPNLTVFNSALGNPNSAPSYATTTAYGGSHWTHGQGGGYSSHGSGTGNMHATQRGAGGGFNGNGSDAGNMHPIHNVAVGRGGGYNDHDNYRIRPGHSPNQCLYMWQFMDEKGFWITYGQASSTGFSSGKTRASSDDIERHFVATKGRLPMKIKTPLNDYELDFVTGVQLNTTTGARKHIRREPLQHHA